MLDRVLVDTVIGERREAEQCLDSFAVPIVDQLANEIGLNILVVSVVLPGHGKFPGTKSAADPEQHRVAAVGVDPVVSLLPFGQPESRHATEREIVTADFDRLIGCYKRRDDE